jgi:hypothetical protein
MTNSAGFRAATPTRQTSRPLSRSFWLIAVRSQRTKNAFSGLSPMSAPICHSLSRKPSIVRLTLAYRRSPLGSKTAYRMPISIERSR